MSYTDLRRRLDRIEAERGSGAPTRIMTDRPIPEPGEPDETANALADWRALVDDGSATVRNGVLWLTAPTMASDEWAIRFESEHERLH